MQDAMLEVLGSNPYVMHNYCFAFFAYILVCTSMNQVCLGTYKDEPGLYGYILVREVFAYVSGLSLYIPSSSCYILLKSEHERVCTLL
jgi:hypothetical protein